MTTDTRVPTQQRRVELPSALTTITTRGSALPSVRRKRPDGLRIRGKMEDLFRRSWVRKVGLCWPGPAFIRRRLFSILFVLVLLILLRWLFAVCDRIVTHLQTLHYIRERLRGF